MNNFGIVVVIVYSKALFELLFYVGIVLIPLLRFDMLFCCWNQHQNCKMMMADCQIEFTSKDFVISLFM